MKNCKNRSGIQTALHYSEYWKVLRCLQTSLLKSCTIIWLDIPDNVGSYDDAVNDLQVAFLIIRNFHLFQIIFEISANSFFHRVSAIKSKISGRQLIKF